MNVMVFEKSNPKKRAWEMSSQGFERLDKEKPGKYAIFQQLQSVQKKNTHTVVVEPISSEKILKINKEPIVLKEAVPNGSIVVEKITTKKKRGTPKA